MKKTLSILLAIVMLLSFAALAACKSNEGGSDDNGNNGGSVSEETLNDSKPNEYIQEKLDAGWDLTCGYAAIADNFFTNQILGEGIREYVESIGMTYSFQSAEENASELITLLENFVSMQTPIVVCLPPDGDIVQSAVEAAQEAGTFVVLWGTSANYDTIVATYDQAEYGRQIGLMAVAWVDQHFGDVADGSVKAAVFYQTAVVDVIARSNALMDALESDSRIEIVFTVDDPTNTVDVGYTHAEEAFTVSPDLNLICALDVSAAIGANNYVMARPDVNVEDFAIFTGGFEDTLLDLIAQSETGDSVLRGTIQDGESTADSTINTIKELVAGTITYPYAMYQPLFAVTSADFTFDYDSREE